MQIAQFLELNLDQKAALLIGQCARGTPRIAKKIVRRIRDFSQVQKRKATQAFVQEALSFLGIDQEGLTKVDNMILQKMVEHFNGGPVGLETLASMIGEDAETIEVVYEPYLMRKGYIEKTPRGRQIPHKILPRLVKKFLGQDTLL